jgi:excinuclease ABC subunit C
LEQRAADEAATLLNMEQMNHVVCFDMAQLQGDERVGASVVMRNGRPAKKEYRTYIVKGDAMDDLRMMSEVVERWLKRQEEWPDLLLLDGGETHLKTIQAMLDEHGVHRKRRKKSRLGDPLEDVLGLGAKKLQSLLRHFGGRQGINNASIEDLKTVPGIGPSLAERIHESLHR